MPTTKTKKKQNNAQRVTIKTIAEKANVTPMTVSLALRNSPKISETTKKHINSMAQRLGYRPSQWARALRSQKTQMVALLLPNKVPQFFGKMYETLQESLVPHDYQPMLAITHSSAKQTGKLIDRCIDAFDAIVICPVADVHANEYFIDKLKSQHKPFIVLGPFSYENVDCIINDEVKSSSSVVNWFITHGHKKIGFVSGYFYEVDKLRFEGYKKALIEAGIGVDENLISISQNYWGEEAGYLGAKSLLKRAPDITAIFANVDITAVGVYRAIREAELRIPDDISVFGYADLEEAQKLNPTLSSVNQHPEIFGREIARLLMRRLQKDLSDYPAEILIPTSLIIRDSVRER